MKFAPDPEAKELASAPGKFSYTTAQMAADWRQILQLTAPVAQKVKTLFQAARGLQMFLLVRETQQMLLRRKLVPAKYPSAVTVTPLDYAASIHQRYSNH
jgi:hypothetical protein